MCVRILNAIFSSSKIKFICIYNIVTLETGGQTVTGIAAGING